MNNLDRYLKLALRAHGLRLMTLLPEPWVFRGGDAIAWITYCKRCNHMRHIEIIDEGR